MAYMTAEQAEREGELEREYGIPHRVFLERTSDPYGILRLSWRDGRELHIRPDGSRLAWDTLKVGPEQVSIYKWYPVTHDGIVYDVKALTQANAEGMFAQWLKLPVEVDWVKVANAAI